MASHRRVCFMTTMKIDCVRRALRGGALALALGVAGFAIADVPPAWAQRPQRAEQAAPPAGGGGAAGQSARPAAQRQLPADSVTDQTIELPGRTLRFKATAGSIPLN